VKKVLILFILFSGYSCDNQSGSKETLAKENYNNFPRINYENLLKNKNTLYLSQIAKEVEYIKLETNNECVIANEPQYFFTDSLIFVNNNDHVLKFSRSGKFLEKIGTSGRGPEEIDYIRTMSVLPEKNLIAIQKNSDQKLLYFSFDGSFIKSTSIPRFQNIKVLKNGNFLGYESGNLGSEKNSFLLINEKGDSLSGVHNTDTWASLSSRSLDIRYNFEPFYIFNDELHFKSMYNDTVFSILSNRIVSSYFIDMGKFKIPQELRPERALADPTKMQIFSKKANDYFFCNVFESTENIFLTTANFKDWDIKYLIYNKSTGDGCLLINQNKESSGILNDWDGGIDFWPKGYFENNKIYMPASALKIKEVLAEGNSGLNFSMDKNSKLRKLMSETDDTSNPIIMVITLKN
jgi:hypothetical protein